MATSPDSKNVTPSPKKPGDANSRFSEIQKRAERMASKKRTPPKQFLSEAWVELKKTTWPTRDVLIKSVSVVLALVVSVGAFVGGLDYLLTRVTSSLFSGR
jgi:preprotein translocase subunit SecE